MPPRPASHSISVFGTDWLVPVGQTEQVSPAISKAIRKFQWNGVLLDGRLPRARAHVLVLGYGDVESGAVIKEFRRRRVSFIALNLLDLMTEGQLEITSRGIGRIVIGNPRHKVIDVNLNSVQSVFYSAAPFFPPWPSLEKQNQWSDVDILYWRWLQFLEALQLFVPADAWVPGVPENLGYIQQKKLQDLQFAQSLGLCIPDWIMTTQRHALETFSLDKGPVIFRDPLRHIERKKKEWTFVATPKFLGQFNWNGFSEAPHVFQAFIHKRAEYRVVVVGTECFTMKITSSEKNSKPDWRTEDLKKLKFSKARLPKILSDKLVKIAQSRKLTLATIDLLEDQDGHFIFLEMNRPGKWLFVELLTGAPLTKTLGKIFVSNQY